MKLNDDLELSLISDSKYDSGSDIELEDGDITIPTDVLISPSKLKPILRTSPKLADEPTKKIKWVDELEDDPRPLHEERPHPRWIKTNHNSFFVCNAQSFRLWATFLVIVAAMVIALIFLAKYFFWNSNASPPPFAPVRNRTRAPTALNQSILV